MFQDNEWVVLKEEKIIYDFYINYEERLVYKLIYNDRSLEEKIIDIEVDEFSITEDSNKNIHGVYTKENEMYYFFFDYKQVIKKRICENKTYISELGIIIANMNINIFFIEKPRIRSISGKLTHCIYKEDGFILTHIDDIGLLSQNDMHYEMQKFNGEDILILYLSKCLDEVELNISIYKEQTWSKDINIYKTKGSRVEFSSICSEDKIIILNLSKNNGEYLLEVVEIKPDSRTTYRKIIDTRQKIYHGFLMEYEGLLWIMWQGETELFGVKYDETEYAYIMDLYNDLEENREVKIYYCIIENKKIISKKVIGREIPRYDFMFPNKISLGNKVDLHVDNYINKQHIKSNLQEIKEKINDIKDEKNKIERILKDLDDDFKKRNFSDGGFPGNTIKNEESYEALVEELERIKKINNEVIKGCV